MRLTIERVITTGTTVLDRGITDLEVYVGDSGVLLVSSTGRNGGLAGYAIAPGGGVSLRTSVVFPETITGIVADRIVVDPGTGRIYVGADGGGLIAWGVGANLALTGRLGTEWAVALAQARGESDPVLEATITQTPRATDLLPPGTDADQIVALESVMVQGRQVVLIACADTHSLVSHIRDPATGALIRADQVGAAEGLGIQAPSGMETVVINGTTLVVLVSAGTSSVTVLRVGVDGRLEPVEHVIDTATTRFEGAQAVAVVQAGAHTFVIVGGADHGITLFLLTAEGRLVYLDTIADTAALSLANVSAIEAVVVDGILHVFVGSQIDTGITHLTIPIANLGVARAGNPGEAMRVTGGTGDDILTARTSGDTLEGGGGTDVLLAGPGRTALTGGAGADIFVAGAGSTRMEVADFQRGQDRLDLSALPMLRDVGQLTITPTANGARIDYRGVQIHITSADGQPLNAADLFPAGLLTPDRIPILPRALPPEPPREVRGTEGADTLTGGTGNDTIWGLGGGDRIDLIGGNNEVWAGAGNDTINVGPGNDTIWGGDGNDLIYGTAGGRNTLGGGAGNDTIHGGPDAETIFGGLGNDLLYSGGGANRVFGGEGNDTIRGGDGGNGLGGGPGEDDIHGARGNDTIWGTGGNDRLWGYEGRDEVWGGPGNDSVWGGVGNDTVGGGAGNDFLYGEDGNDVLWAGPGDDRLWGGPGADRFVFYPGFESNRVMDFDPTEGDRLQLGADLWQGAGALTAEQIVERYGRVNEFGSAVLDFTASGGTVIVLVGYDDLGALAAAIDIL